MSVKVIDGKVRADGITYEVDEVIESLDKKEEARLISLGVVEKVEEAEDNKNESVLKKLNAEDCKKMIDSAETVEELKVLLDDEESNKQRKTVIDAIKAKIEELTSSEENNDADDNDSSEE